MASDRFTRWSLLDYFLVTALVFVSGNELLTGTGRRQTTYIVITLICFGIFIFRSQTILTRRFIYFIFLFVFLLIVQSLAYDYYVLLPILGILLRMSTGYMVVRAVRDFPSIYVDVMVGLTLLSWCFYIPEQIGHQAGIDIRVYFQPLRNFLSDYKNFHIFVYNFETVKQITRNASIFWEPGANAGYTLIALGLLGLIKEQLQPRAYLIKCTILIFGLLSTFSTMGYLTLPVVLLMHLNVETTIRIVTGNPVKFLLLALVVAGALMVVNQEIEHLIDKVTNQFSDAQAGTEESKRNRFGNFLLDLGYIAEHPLIGWGLNRDNQYIYHPGLAYQNVGNGLTGAMRYYGIPIIIVFFAMVYRGLFIISGRRKMRSLLMIASMLLMLNGEFFFNFPLFWGLAFLSFPKAARMVKSSPTGIADKPPPEEPTPQPKLKAKPS